MVTKIRWNCPWLLRCSATPDCMPRGRWALQYDLAAAADYQRRPLLNVSPMRHAHPAVAMHVWFRPQASPSSNITTYLVC